MVAPTVLEAMSRPVIGHLDPEFIRCMEEIKQMLRAVFRTSNEMTFPVSGTGSAGMELCMVNLLEPGDEAVICVNGVFGGRMAELAERCGATVRRIEAEWGRIIEPEQVQEALRSGRPKLVAVVHAETSTGALTPIEEIAPIVRESGALLVVDAVTSLGGCPVDVDAWGIDAVYSGTQKCLSCPPGLAPVSLSQRAVDAARNRGTKVQSWYLDVNLLSSYWGEGGRTYHHTAPISMNYALHEALRLVLEEGLEARWSRHERMHYELRDGLEELGLTLTSQPGHQLWQLNAVRVPDGVDHADVRRRLLEEHSIEIGGPLGDMPVKWWRVGLMGETARSGNVQRFIAALGSILEPVQLERRTGA
jgi:alanine-glyoxylate transaminase/serine-glyoxylate transaminase/serine-pyruvate transaminase